MSARFAVDEVVTFRPRVTGGYVVAKVKGILHDARFGYAYQILITDGTRVWPTGTTECVSEETLD